MAIARTKDGIVASFSKGDLRRYYFHDAQELAVHVDQLRRTHNWTSVRDWARGDFLSWYAANVAPKLKFIKICPAAFPSASRFCGFDFDDFCFVFRSLGIIDQKTFHAHRDFFTSLRKNNPHLYYRVICFIISDFDIGQEFINRRSLGIDDLKQYCVLTGTSNISQLSDRFPAAGKILKENGWNRSWFWDAVKIVLKIKVLPPDFNPIESILLLSKEDLEFLEYVPDGPIEI